MIHKKNGGSLTETDIPILVVDDFRDNLDLMEALLMGEGFGQVLLADHGEQALALLEKYPNTGVVLLDLMMPDIDGYEICKRIADNPRTRHIPVIVVTGAAFRQNEALQKSFAAGAIDFLTKPLNETELFARIRSALTLYRERMLRQASVRAVAENETRFRTIINQAPIGIAHIDARGGFLMVNDSLCALSGYSNAELADKTIQALILGQESLAGLEDLLKQTTSRYRLTLEIRLQPKQAQPVWIHLSATPLNDACSKDKTFVLIIENITERKATADKMERMVFYDALTRLPNRVLFNDRLKSAIQQAKRSGELLAVLFFDLDNFKTINDSLGHTTGDHLLQSVVARIQSCLRKDDLFARFGGDEFTLLLERVGSVENACTVAQKILDRMQKTVVVDGHEFYVGASIGVSFFPQDGEDAGALIKNADTAMYRAKELGRRNYQLFNPALDTQVQQRLDIEQDLRRSLQQGDFQLYYQPQIDLENHRITAMEALLRWRHPKRGLLDPMTFLPLAEETGLIIALGHWVIHEACAQAKRWEEQGYGDLAVYVNLSRRQFQQTDLIAKIDTILKEHNLAPAKLGIEITESVNSLDIEAIISSLKSLNGLGVKLALDDFGLGFSSLNNLKHFPLDALKIDKSFVQDAMVSPGDLAIVKSVIALGKSFGLRVIAEGVENKQLLQFVVEQGCAAAQGYFFSEPLPPERLTGLLDGSAAHRDWFS